VTVAVPDARSREFFGDAAQAASFEAALARLEALGARIMEIDFRPSTTWRRCSTKAPGWPSA
jgi:Asp-tRNA(Asn)/Glu-tRNA(Gln) amidotransferase A subunit family amidase